MRVSVSVTIDAPPEVVWADVSQMDTHAEWMGDAERIEVVSDVSTGVGTVMRVPSRVGPLTTVDWIIVTAWVPLERIGVVHTGLVTGEGEFRLEREGEGTRFVWDETLTLPASLGGRLGEAIARPIMAWIWRANLSRFATRFT